MSTAPDDITPRQAAIINKVKREWLHRGLKDKSFDLKRFKRGINWLYRKCEIKPPHVIVTDSPMAAQCAAHLIENNPSIPKKKWQSFVDKNVDITIKVPLHSFSPWGSMTDYGWVSFYDAMERIGVDLGYRHNEFHKLMDFLKAGHYDFIALEDVVVVCMKPAVIKQKKGCNHSLKGPAIAWKDGYELYCIEGRSYSKDQWKQELKQRRSNSRNKVVGSIV